MKIVRTQASLLEKIVIRGRLHLDTPLLIGSGERVIGNDGQETNSILKNKYGSPWIPGTSLAGVLRDMLSRQKEDLAESLFGWTEANDSAQSMVDIADIMLKNGKLIRRDGVQIDEWTGTAKKNHVYRFEAVDRGYTGDLEIIVTLREVHRNTRKELVGLLKEFVRQLAAGFSLGAGTMKGFGKVSCSPVTMVRYDFASLSAGKAWLEYNPQQDIGEWLQAVRKNRLQIYEGQPKPFYDENDFIVDADFQLTSSLLIRCTDMDQLVKKGGSDEKESIAAVQLSSQGAYVIPGTTWKGILRKQAEKICRAFGKPLGFLQDVMGYAQAEVSKKSRFLTAETYIAEAEVQEAAQSRIRVDRFTGGTMDKLLFTTIPIWKNMDAEAPIHLHFEIRNCSLAEAGLALFILRDLWQGRIALGGEKSIGRGTLAGHAARIHYQGDDYTLDQEGRCVEGQIEKARLESFANAFRNKLTEEGAATL